MNCLSSCPSTTILIQCKNFIKFVKFEISKIFKWMMMKINILCESSNFNGVDDGDEMHDVTRR